MTGNGANFDESGAYRYLLWRTWDESRPHVLWVMLNPSTAGTDTSDQTVRTCIEFSRVWGYGGLEIVNLFACKAKEFPDLKAPDAPHDPIGSKNDRYIRRAAQRATRIVVGWGENGVYLERDQDVCRLLLESTSQPLYCLGTNLNGTPRHPLYVPRNTPLTTYSCR